MNIRHVFQAVLVVATALLLVSCGGLTSAKGETETFSCSLGSVISEASARNSGLTGTATYTITLKSTQGNAYFRKISDTAAVSTLNTMTLDFEDVPVGVELAIHIFIETDQELYFEGESEPFTMQTGKDAELSIALEKLFSTPYFLWNIKPNGAGTTLYTSENLSRKTELGEGSTDFCFDDDATLWTIDNDYESDKGQIWKYVNNQKTGPYTIAGNYISSLDYDFETNRFFALYQDTEDWSYHLMTFDADVLKSMNPGEITPASDKDLSTTNMHSFVAASVNNNIFYYISVMSDCTKWYLNKVSYPLDDTPLAEPVSCCMDELDLFSYTNGAQFLHFWDLQVVDDDIYVLASQWYQYNQNIDSEKSVYNRGAILRFKCSDSGFSYTGVYGMQPVTQETISVSPFHYGCPLYQDYQLTKPAPKLTFSWKRAIPEKGNCSSILLGPKKFIAIKPKKLVIADCGAVYYVDEDGMPKTSKESRIAYFDLESFAITTTPFDYNFGNNPIGGSAASDMSKFYFEKIENQSFYYSDGSDTRSTLSQEFSLDMQLTY